MADINRSNVAFSVFDGDLKSGGDSSCSDSLYYTARDDFNTLERPLIVVPGDNDGPTAGDAMVRARCRTSIRRNRWISSVWCSSQPIAASDSTR